MLDGENQATNDCLLQWSRLFVTPAGGLLDSQRTVDLGLGGDFNAVEHALTDRSESIRWLRLQSRQDPRPRMPALRGTEDLIGVSLRGVSLTNSQLIRLADSKELRWLDIRTSRLVGQASDTILEFPNVEVALLGHAKLPVERLAKMRFSKRLKTLGLTGTDVTDAELARILARCGELRCLNLMGCRKLTSKSRAPLSELKHLQYLCIIDTALVGSANKLSRELEGCVVSAID